MKKIEFGKTCYDGWQNSVAWSGTLLCQILSHTHRFLVPIWVDRSSDGTVCVRVSVWVWGKWKVKVAVGTIPQCPPLHPSFSPIRSSIILPYQDSWQLGARPSLFSFYIPLFFSIGASCQLTTVTREITSGLMRRSLWCTGPAPIQHML